MSAAVPRSEPKRKKASWFYWHSAFGALFGFAIFLIALSGAFATIGREIDWLLTPSLRVSATAPRASWGQLHEALQQHGPKGVILQIDAPERPGFAAVALLETPDGLVQAHLDPATGEVRAVGSLFGVWRFFRSLHANLFDFFSWGRYVVGALGVALLLLLVTALAFFKHWWRHFLDAHAPRHPPGRWSPTHKLAGLWALWFTLLIALSGAWYLVDIVRFHYGDGREAMTAPPRLAKSDEPRPRLLLDALVERVRAVRPDLTITQIRFGHGDRPDYLEGYAGYTLVRGRANHAYVDPHDGAILATQHASDLTAYWRIAELMDPLHFGDFAGLSSRLVWFVFGLALSLSALSGAWMMARWTRQHGGKARAAGRRMRWAGLALAAALLAGAAEGGIAEHAEFARAAPVATGVYAVILAWIAATLAATALWFYELR